jgi:hypothetical protein
MFIVDRDGSTRGTRVPIEHRVVCAITAKGSIEPQLFVADGADEATILHRGRDVGSTDAGLEVRIRAWLARRARSGSASACCAGSGTTGTRAGRRAAAGTTSGAATAAAATARGRALSTTGTTCCGRTVLLLSLHGRAPWLIDG